MCQHHPKWPTSGRMCGEVISRHTSAASWCSARPLGTRPSSRHGRTSGCRRHGAFSTNSPNSPIYRVPGCSPLLTPCQPRLAHLPSFGGSKVRGSTRCRCACGLADSGIPATLGRVGPPVRGAHQPCSINPSYSPGAPEPDAHAAWLIAGIPATLGGLGLQAAARTSPAALTRVTLLHRRSAGARCACGLADSGYPRDPGRVGPPGRGAHQPCSVLGVLGQPPMPAPSCLRGFSGV